MMVMTAKVNMKKIAIILAAAVGILVALILMLGGKDTTTAAPAVSNNDGRVNSLDGLILMRYLNGWNVTLG